jgi:DNA-binding CsgD family transcriptional regulator
MTPADVSRILDQLDQHGPQRRLSGKRAQLTDVRERLLELHARGHSWRAIARELSTTGETVTADLLRSVCKAKPKRRHARSAQHSTEVPAAPQPAPCAARGAHTAGSATPASVFGAKGLQL